jgi:hypothetical protein
MDILVAKEVAKYNKRHGNDVVFHKSRNGQWMYCSRKYAEEHKDVVGRVWEVDEILSMYSGETSQHVEFFDKRV